MESLFTRGLNFLWFVLSLRLHSTIDAQPPSSAILTLMLYVFWQDRIRLRFERRNDACAEHWRN